MMSPLDIICINTSGGTRTHTCDILSVVPLPIGLRSQKRKVWDSNPQGAFTPNGFQDRLLIRPVTFQTVPPRLELGQEVPKTPVLPLHHGTYNTPGWTRTSNLRLRRPLLYPIELQALKIFSAPMSMMFCKENDL